MAWRPFSVALFDCDSTLSTVEGIDELANDPQQQEALAALTDSAMDGGQPLEAVYGQRLAMTNPDQTRMRQLKERYKSEAVPHAREVIAALNDSAIETWIVSGGLAEPVLEFAVWLGIDPDKVKAVQTEFDPFGTNWWEPTGAAPQYTEYVPSDLTRTDGKGQVINSSVSSPGRRILIGDGMSDLAAADAVDLFVGYGGVIARDAVTQAAPVVVMSPSLAPLLALALGPDRVRSMIGGRHNVVAQACWELIEDGALRFNDEALKARFSNATDAARAQHP